MTRQSVERMPFRAVKIGCASRRRPQFKRLHKYLLDMDRNAPNLRSTSSPGICATGETEALKRYRTRGEKVTVQHVSVSEGGQAIVGNVTQGLGETVRDKAAASPPAQVDSCLIDASPGAILQCQAQPGDDRGDVRIALLSSKVTH